VLAIERQLDESIIINDNIEVMVINVRGEKGNEKVRLGITAPRHISIHRKEIQDAIDREKGCAQALTA